MKQCKTFTDDHIIAYSLGITGTYLLEKYKQWLEYYNFDEIASETNISPDLSLVSSYLSFNRENTIKNELINNYQRKIIEDINILNHTLYEDNYKEDKILYKPISFIENNNDYDDEPIF